MHAWYSRTAHEASSRPQMVSIFGTPGKSEIRYGNVQFVTISGKEVIATVVSDTFEFDDEYQWPDKIYLGEFDAWTQRTVPADTVPVLPK